MIQATLNFISNYWFLLSAFVIVFTIGMCGFIKLSRPRTYDEMIESQWNENYPKEFDIIY